MSAKILKVVFVILLLVTIGELGYYFYVLRLNPLKGINLLGQITNDTTSTGLIETQITSTPIPKLSLEENFLNSSVFQYVQLKGQNEGQKITLTLEQSGFIGEVDLKEGQKMSPHFTIVDSNGIKIVTFIISDTLNLFKIVKDEKIPITLNELKTGSRIVIRSENDLVNPKKSIEEFLIYDDAK